MNTTRILKNEQGTAAADSSSCMDGHSSQELDQKEALNPLNQHLKFYTLNRLRGDGFLVLPLSVSRLATGQSPERIYEMCEYFYGRLESYNSDVILLYASGLYLNCKDPSYLLREKINNQMIEHSIQLRRLIDKGRRFVPGLFHFLPFEYLYLNSKDFPNFLSVLKQRAKHDSDFRACIEKDLAGRPHTDENRQFILEETAVMHLIRRQYVTLPRKLVRQEKWRLIAYPGSAIQSDIYQVVHTILPHSISSNRFHSAFFDYDQKKVVDFASH